MSSTDQTSQTTHRHRHCYPSHTHQGQDTRPCGPPGCRRRRHRASPEEQVPLFFTFLSNQGVLFIVYGTCSHVVRRRSPKATIHLCHPRSRHTPAPSTTTTGQQRQSTQDRGSTDQSRCKDQYLSHSLLDTPLHCPYWTPDLVTSTTDRQRTQDSLSRSSSSAIRRACRTVSLQTSRDCPAGPKRLHVHPSVYPEDGAPTQTS